MAIELVLNTETREISLQEKDSQYDLPEDRISAVCKKEGWDDSKCITIICPNGLEGKLAAAKKCCLGNNNEFIMTRGVEVTPPYSNADVQTIKEKYPEVFRILTGLGLISEVI